MLWHYTDEAGWDAINHGGEIALSTMNVEGNQLPVAWFSSNPLWDYSARANKEVILQNALGQHKKFKLTMDQLANGYLTIPPTKLFRIDVDNDIAPVTWQQYRETSNTPAEILDGMENEFGATPGEWFGSTVAVARESWGYVQKWQTETSEWVTLGAEAVPIVPEAPVQP